MVYLIAGSRVVDVPGAVSLANNCRSSNSSLLTDYFLHRPSSVSYTLKGKARRWSLRHRSLSVNKWWSVSGKR